MSLKLNPHLHLYEDLCAIFCSSFKPINGKLIYERRVNVRRAWRTPSTVKIVTILPYVFGFLNYSLWASYATKDLRAGGDKGFALLSVSMNVACSTLHASYCVAILIRVPAIRHVAIVMLLIDTMAILTAMCAAALAGLKCFPYIGGVATGGA